MDGNYTLKVSGEQPVLVFSYIGYKTLEIPGNKPTLNVTMSDDTQVIDEVVVTALGIKREKKMLGYAVQEIKSDQLNKTGDPSVTSALQGKVAGLQMNTAGTGLGGSTLKGTPRLRFVVIPPYQTITNLYGLSMVCLSATTTVLTLLTMAV